MKNKQIPVTKSSEKNSIPNLSEETEPEFKQLLIDAGRSKKAADELLKWYTNSN